MKLSQLTGDYQKMRVITYNADQTRAVYHTRNVKPLNDVLFVGEPKPGEYDAAIYQVYVRYPGQEVGMWLFRFDERPDSWNAENNTQNVEESAVYHMVHTQEAFIAKVNGFIHGEPNKPGQAAYYLRFTELEYLKHVAPQLEEAAWEAKRRYTEARERQAIEREQKRQEEDAAFVSQQNAVAQQKIDAALNVIRNGGKLENVEITTYPTDRWSGKTTSLIAWLMDDYCISLPLRTRGWINNSMADVVINPDGSLGNCRYHRRTKNEKGSTSVWKYLRQLVSAVRAGQEVSA